VTSDNGVRIVPVTDAAIWNLQASIEVGTRKYERPTESATSCSSSLSVGLIASERSKYSYSGEIDLYEL
jgi:hypothetical protein